MEKVRSQEEIDALAHAARGGALDAYQKPLPPAVKLWDVRESGQIGREQMQSISVLHEGFARSLTHSLGAYLRIVFQAALASAKPTISSTVSPFMCRATSSAAICASVQLPERTSDMTSRASSRESDWRWLAMQWRASVIMGRL